MKRAVFTAVAFAALVARSSEARAAGVQSCGGEDAATCPPNANCVPLDGGTLDDGGLGTCVVQNCNQADAAVCGVGAYCALPDAGPILDGAAGACAPEPCLVSTDCSGDDGICDTSQNPFACVECISGSDCSGDDGCDVTTHMCVPPPPVPDAGPADGAVEDGAAADGAAIDGAVDGASTDASSGEDASLDASADAGDASDGGPSSDASPIFTFDASGPAGPVSSLAGGACDCDLAAPESANAAALAISFGLGVALLGATRRKRR